MDCCLQEKVFNKYYTVLASKLCEHEKNHKFTLQVSSLPLWSVLSLVNETLDTVAKVPSSNYATPHLHSIACGINSKNWIRCNLSGR